MSKEKNANASPDPAPTGQSPEPSRPALQSSLTFLSEEILAATAQLQEEIQGRLAHEENGDLSAALQWAKEAQTWLSKAVAQLKKAEA